MAVPNGPIRICAFITAGRRLARNPTADTASSVPAATESRTAITAPTETVTPEQSKAIQEAVFKKGGSWANGDAYVKHQAYHFLVIDYGCLTYCVTEDDFYEENGDVKQVFARDALALISESTAIKQGERI